MRALERQGKMAPLPWMSVYLTEGHVLLRDHRPRFSDVAGGNGDDMPSLVTFIGDRVKSSNIAALLTKPKAYKRHQTVQLHRGASKAVDSPEMYADCEIQLARSEQKPFVSPRGCAGIDYATHEVGWFCTDNHKSEDFPAYVIANILTPLSSVLCVFADDFGGFPGVASFLASQVGLPAAHSLPAGTLPHVLVVVSASSTTYDNASAAENLITQILHNVAATKAYIDTTSALRDLKSRYRAVSIHGFTAKAPARQRTAELRERLISLQKEVYWSRRTGRYLFKAKHLTEFSNRMITKLSTDGRLFNFLQHSRTEHFETEHLSTHLMGLLDLIPGQNWLWSIVVPLLASALFMASYPPESHHFPPEKIFTEFFAAPCKQALNMYTRDVDIRTRVISSIKARLEEHFRHLEFDPAKHSALNQHRQCLETLWPHLAETKSNRSCLSCLMFMPEKVFQCGHAICDVCVRRFGRSTSAEKHSFAIPSCVLCGCDQPKDCGKFLLKPPTAGIRILCLDGGGIRGVIPLMFLKHLEDELNGLGGTISDCFDYVCGTSAGGMAAIGVFLMRWSPSECLRRFEELATVTFKANEQSESLTWSKQIQRLFRVCLQDHRYNLTPIEKAFMSKAGSATKMFNPIQSDTKVAVTTTSARDNVTGVISNYNYGPRLGTNTYRHIRATQPQHDMTVSEAAACTSAAPFFFKSKYIDWLGTFQDGGLNHNNPAFLAAWECETIWPEKCHIVGAEPSNILLDHFISLGTGTTAAHPNQLDPHSPILDRFYKRLSSSFNHQLNSEEQWKRFIRCVPASLLPRFTRLNVPLHKTEPALDDVPAIAQLKSMTSSFIESNATVLKVKNNMFASLFYLEVDDISRTVDGMYRISVTIYCRLPLEFNERKKFYYFLLRKHALFVANNKAIPCVSTLPSGFPMFRCAFDLLLRSMTDDICVRLTGITSEPVPISGMPTQLQRLVKAQRLEMPFGSIDNRHVEKPLPSAPQKRKATDIS